MHKPVSHDRIFLGVASACLAFFLLAIMLGTSKLLNDSHSVFEIVFYRNAIPAIILFISFVAKKRFDLFHCTQPLLLTFRVMIGSVGLLTTFAAVKYLPVSTATVIFFTSTLYVPIMAYIFLKERIGWHRCCAIAVGMSAVFFIAQPSSQAPLIGIVLGFVAAFAHATIQILLRALKSETPMMVTFYFMLGGALITSFIMPFVATMPTIQNWIYILIVAATGGSAQYFLTVGFKNAPASLISPFNYISLIWASGFDLLVFHIVPGWNVYAGAAVIIGAQAYILYREHINRRNRTEDIG